jgi:hypothetical protein
VTLDPGRLAMIRDNAELVVSEFGRLNGSGFGLDKASVEWVEGFIERLRGNASDEADGGRTRIAAVLACYLGEAIIAEAGGHWDETEGGELGIRFDNDNWCFPFAKVAKQFADGTEGGESILSFYIVSTTIAARQGFDRLSDGSISSKAKIKS